jgi:acylglycerol lipase
MQHIEFTQQAPDGVQFYFQGWQPETPPKAVVCLVHGLGEHSGRYAHVAATLNDAGYVLLGFDLRGHGKSGGPRGHTPSYETLMDDIGRLLAEAAQRYPDQPQFLYGHSLGGNLVLNYALRRKPGLAGVVATSPAIRTATPPPGSQITLAKVMNKIRPGMQMSNGLALDGLARDPEVIRAYTNDPLVHNKISVRLALEMLQAGEWALAHAAEFPSATASAEFAKKVPGDCTFKLWDGFYHETHNEPEKAEVLSFMIDWLLQYTPQ